MNLKAHAHECIQKLSIFSSPEYDPENTMKVKFSNDSLILYYEPSHVAEVDTLLNKWTHECRDLFDHNVYAPKFFSDNPLSELLSESAKKRLKEQINAAGNDSLTKIQEEKDNLSASYHFTFRRGVLQSIGIMPKKGKNFQYTYNGTNIFWDRTNIVHSIAYEDNLLKKDTMIVTSGYYEPYGTLLVPKKQVITKKDYPELNESFVNGKFEFDQQRFNAMPKGTVTRNWTLQIEGTIGLNFLYYTDELLEDTKINKDSVQVIGPLDFGFDWDATLGLQHCNPKSGRCYGFGAGYGAYVYMGPGEDEKNSWGQTESTFHSKVTHSVKMYGEYFLNGKTSLGLKEAISIPVTEKMKYTLSQTSIVSKGSNFKAELGLGISPIQYIPSPYFNIGFAFQPPAF